MYVVVACENRRIFRLLLCFDLPFLRFKIFAFLLNFSTSGLYFSNSGVKTQQLSSCHVWLAIDKYQTNIIGCGFRRKQRHQLWWLSV